jgi:ABC-type branched-subunit amino acid transport system substrate-binding protein/streptogramin lyase
MLEDSPPGVGSTFGRFRIEAVLGRGGMGVVHRAFDEQLQRRIALKLLAAGLADDRRFRERFLRESRLAAAIEHPAIVPIYDAGEIGGLLFIAMRYVAGSDLATILRAEGALEPQRAVALVAQLADALDAAHAQGLIHRDVKPSNALVAGEGARERAYLVDFGITQEVQSPERLTDSGTLVGTVDYLAPERIRGATVDGRADVYSLGCVLFQCLTGEVPFPRDSDAGVIYAHLEEEPPAVSERRVGLPGALDAAVAKALAKSPDDRWRTCCELAAAAEVAIGRTATVVTRRRRARRRQRRATVALGAAAVLAVAAVAAVVLLGGGDQDGGLPAITAGQVIAFDAVSGRKKGRPLPAGETPTALAVSGGKLWMVDAETRTLLRLDPKTGKLDATSIGKTPIDVSTGPGGVWVSGGVVPARGLARGAFGPVVDEVVRLDPGTQRQQASVSLRGVDQALGPSGENQLAQSAHALWAITADAAIVRIDTASNRVTNTKRLIGGATAIAAGQAGVWALAFPNKVRRLDERTGRVVRKVRIDDANAIAVGEDAAWVTGERKLYRIGTEAGSIPGSVDVDAGSELVATPRSVWTANAATGTVTQVDPDAMRVQRVREVGGAPRSLATDGRTVWLAASGTSAAVQSNIAGVRAVASATCDPVVGGNDGKADLLVTSDLPLQGNVRLTAPQMADAITFVLREHRFRAGRWRIAYQSCDDALPSTGQFDEAKCVANGRAYAGAADVVAVIGSYYSGCTEAMLPSLNRATGGPVPMISPVNSFVELTRETPPDDEQPSLGELYPTGRRNFVRVYPADDMQGVAFAQFARDRGHTRVFVLQDGPRGYSHLIADAFATRARPLGLDVVGRARWSWKSDSYRDLAARIKRTRAEAVLVSGFLGNNGGRLVRDLRAGLGPQVDLMVPDGFAPPAELIDAAGRAARGVFLSYSGAPLAQLPAAGQRFAKRFERAQPGVKIDQFAVYAAQATETLLDAIERSDGTRAGVLDALFATKTDEGLIGEVRFDERGDIVQSAATILRVVGGATDGSVTSTSGAVIKSVEPVSPKSTE